MVKTEEIRFISEDTKFPLKDIEIIRATLAELLTGLTKDKCPGCNHLLNLTIVDVAMYDHEWGWQVHPDYPKQWLSIQCDYCEYEVSFSKLGIHRSLSP